MVNKKHISLAILLLIFSKVYTQKANWETIDLLKSRKDNVLKTGLFAPLWGPIPLTSEWRIVYETPTSSHTSIQAGLSKLGQLFWIWPLLVDSMRTTNPLASQFTIKGFRVQLAYKFYVFKDQMAPSGIYIAPFLSYSSANFGYRILSNVYQTYVKAVYMNANLIMGYQFFYDNSIAVDLYFGAGYRENSWMIYQFGQPYQPLFNADELQLWKGPLKLVLGINVGIGY